MGEGQLDAVHGTEIPQLLEAFHSLGEQYKYVFLILEPKILVGLQNLRRLYLLKCLAMTKF